MEEPKAKPTAAEFLRATRPWWIVPIVVIFGLGVALALMDGSPLRSMAYSVM